MGFYSMQIDMHNKHCLVVGGGKVAYRKVKKLIAAGAIVTILSEKIDDMFKDVDSQFYNVVKKTYQSGCLDGFFAVFAATSSRETNKQVVADAKASGVLVNCVDSVADSTFIIPASAAKSVLKIDLSTEGKAPILSKQLRKYFQQKLMQIDEELIDDIVKLRKNMVESNEEIMRNLIEKKITNSVNKIIERLD